MGRWLDRVLGIGYGDSVGLVVTGVYGKGFGDLKVGEFSQVAGMVDLELG